ncbi:hypothetical protein [Klebsiella pneumoniae]|uniref:hypothetical protein n=1 Tax=Klebsiella TaxID=570 RepID=UPI000DEACF18|nr:hypothetical protein [Klebsiella pneumoniae]MBD8427804.1 hypothetical protein [Klebsiella pneumoniae]RBW73196.1 hypothetical protein DQW56_17335 [Klebsiella pneumoniae]HBR6682426.1 hypothetical protein [Klebsiella pneumoniae]HBX7204203.1 hypothetical protein [Klebsiella pneumoniae]HBX7346512.1 hypothetical protein [Klebsiella pneumoniae]
MTETLTYINSIVLALLLVAGGWVKIRDYFRNKAQAKSDAVEAAAKAKADEIEAAVQERLKKLQTAADSTDQTATSVTGTTAVGSGVTA